MAKYINADALADRLDALAYDDWNQGLRLTWVDALKDLERIVRDESAVDAEPVRHGRWIVNRRGNIECSLCGNEPYHDNKRNMNYCPKCGAKMDGEGENERNI